MSWVAGWFNVLPLVRGCRASGAAERSRNARYPSRSTTAMPTIITWRAGSCSGSDCPATFFVATDFLDGGRMWNDTVIETIRAVSGPVLDLRDAGSRHRIPLRARQEKRNAIDALLEGHKYLPDAERAVTVERLAERGASRFPTT